MSKSEFDELAELLVMTEAEGERKKAKPDQTKSNTQEKPPEESPPKPSPARKAVPEPTSESVPTQEEMRTPPNGDASPPGTQFPSGERSHNTQERDISVQPGAYPPYKRTLNGPW